MIKRITPFPQLKAAKLLAALAVAGLAQQAFAAAPAPNALPTGGKVVAGTAAISQAGNTMNINQSSQRAVINWSSFDVGSKATVNFNQPNAQAATLNYVNSASKSMINGAVNANGQVIFVNNNGVVFGKGAEVNVGGMVATTMNTSAKEFMDGKEIQTYEGGTTGKVINKGNITGNNINSYIALMAPQVVNTGVITATMGGNNAIALVAGQKVTLKFSGSQFVSVSVDASVVNALISNKLLINAGNGQVIIGANAAQNLMGSLIKNTGTISASDINTSGGKISLTADSIEQTGTIEANSAQANGGNISLKGNNITLASGSKTTATGATAGGNINVGVNNTSTQSVQNAIDINKLANTVSVQTNATVDASATQSGNGGTINIWSKLSTMIAGALSAKGGAQGGNGGFIETSSKGNVAIAGTAIIDTSAPKGKTGQWTVDPMTLIIDSTAASVISNALNTTNVTLDATGSNSGACAFGACTNSQSPLIRIMAGADIYSNNTVTSLSLIATGGQIDINSNITAGSIYAVAQAINVYGSVKTNGGSNSNIYLAGAIINILGNINSNGNNQNNSSSSNLNSANTITGANRRNGQNGLTADSNTYSSNGGLINILATGNITVDANSYISSNGVNGGVVTITSTAGKVTINGIVDSIGKSNTAGNIMIAGKTETNLIGSLISVEGLNVGGMINLGQINNLGNGTILAPPATAPPALITFVQDSVAAATSNNATSITSSNINIDSQTGINAPNGNIVVFGDQIQVNNSSITAANGTIAIGREAYSAGALSALVAVTNSTLTANKVETSGELLGTDGATVHAAEWLLDPTNVTIGATSTTGTLAGDLANAGVTNIKASDIVSSVNAGGTVNVVYTGTMTQSGILAFAPATGVTGTLTLNNTSGTMGNTTAVTLSGGITNSGAGTINLNVFAKGSIASQGAISSSSGPINVAMESSNQTTTNGGVANNINISGSITTRGGYVVLDGTGGTINGVGTTNPTITRGTDLATSGKGGGVLISSLAVINTTTTGAAASFTTTGGNLVAATSGEFSVSSIAAVALSIGGSINISAEGGNTSSTGGAYGFAPAAGKVESSGNIYVDARTPFALNTTIWTKAGVTSYAGSITMLSSAAGTVGGFGQMAIQGPISAYGPITITATGANNLMNTANPTLTSTAAGTITSTVGAVNITATSKNPTYATTLAGLITAPQVSIAATNTNAAGQGVSMVGATSGVTITANSSTVYPTAGNALSITSTVGTAGTPGGITITGGNIINQSNGGSVSFVTNGDLTVTSAVNFSTANTSSGAQTITYDTRTGNVTSQITTGAFSYNATGATQKVNYVEESNGSNLTIGATSVSGYITVDNTCLSCTSTGVSDLTPASLVAKMTTSAGITVSGALSAGDYISLNGLNNSATVAAVALGTSTLTVTSASTATTAISVIGNHNTANIGNPGIASTGAITDNANGGGILFKSNGDISQTGAVTVAANTSGTASSITYDTTTGNLNSSITSGALTLTGGAAASNTAINYIEKSSGAAITAGAISVPGYILLDNTYGGTAGAGGTPNSGYVTYANASTLATTGTGIFVNGVLSSGAYAGTNAVTVNGVSNGVSGTYAVNIATGNSITAATGDINITGLSPTVYGVYALSPITATAGNVNIIGISGSPSSAGVLIGQPTNIVASGNILISGSELATSTNAAYGVWIYGNATTFTKIAAGGNLTIAGFNSSTSTFGTYAIYTGLQGALYLKSGGDTIIAGSTPLGAGGSTGSKNIYLGSLVTNAASLTVEGASLLNQTNSSGTSIPNVATAVASSSATNGAAGGIGIDIQTSKSVIDGTTFTGINATGNIWMSGTGGGGGLNINSVPITSKSGNITLSGSTGVAASVGLKDVSGVITATAGSVSLTGTSTTGTSVSDTATINAVTGVTITGTGNLGVSAGTAGAVSVTGGITNTGSGGVTVTSTGNTATGAITDSGSGGISITGGRSVAAGTTTNGTITAVGTLANTGGGVISLSMAQPTSLTGGVIESAAGITTTNASTSSNVSYGNIGGVMSAVNAATVNSVNYRSLAQGISVTLKASYTAPYGTAYNSVFATDWLQNPTNATVTVSGVANFGAPLITAAQAQASLIFASAIGGNSNLVQTGTNLDGTTNILSSLGKTVTTTGAGNTYNITPKVLTITGTQLSSTYNGVSTYETVANAGYTISGLVTNFNTGTVASPVTGAATGDAVSSVTHVIQSGGSTMTNSAVAQACSTANCYTNAVSAALGTGLSNYTISYVSGTFNIAKVALSITQANTNLQYTGSAQTVTPTYGVSGLVGSDAVSSLTTNTQTGTANGVYTGTISGANGTGLSNYTITYNPGTLTISSNQTITITALADAKVYGNAVTTTNSLTYNSSGILSFTGLNLGNGTFTSCGCTISGLTGGATISALTLTSLGGVTSAGVGAGSGTGGTYSITPSAASTSLSNIAWNYVPALLTVTPRSITIAATPITTTYGTSVSVPQTAPAGYAVSSGTVVTGDTISSVAVNYYNGSTNSTTVPGSKGAGTYTGVIIPSAATGTGGFNTTNYNITYTPADLVVNKLAVTITANAQSTPYGTALALGTTAFTSSISSLPNGDTITGTTLQYNSSATVPGTTNATTYTNGIVASSASGTGGFGTSNYAITYAAGNLTVTPANVVITPVDLSAAGQSVVYNGATQTFNPTTGFTVTGLQNGQTPVFGTTGLASGLNVGTYANNITSAIIASLTSGSLSNYNITVGSQGSLTITPASLTVTGATTSLAYNGAPQSNASPSVVGLVGIDLVAGNGVTVSGKSSGTNAGTYNDALAVAAAGATQLSNYSITTTNGALTITPIAATITGATTVSPYNGALQTNTYTTSGILSADTSAAKITIGGIASATHVSQGTVPDAFTVTGTSASNYTFTYVPGSITITPVTLTVTGANTTAAYNKTTQTNSVATVTGLKGSDAATIGGSYGSGINVGVYTDALSVSLSNPSDYTVGVTNGSHTITPAIITVNGITAQNKVYDATTAATLNVGTITTTGVLPGDTVTLNTSTLSGAFTDKNVGDGKTVLISGVVLAGASSSNYQLSGGANTTTTANITPAPLSITGSSLTTTYNGSAQSLVAPTVTGLIAGDNVIASGNATGTNAGVYTATYTATGVDAGNYTITSNAPVLTINKASLVVTANNASSFYGVADPALTASVSGLQGTDTSAVISPTYTVTRAAGTAVNSYTITAAGPSSSSNYNISYVPGVFTISPTGVLVITMNAASTTYGTLATPTTSSVQYATPTGVGSAVTVTTLTNTSGNIWTDTAGYSITINPTITSSGVTPAVSGASTTWNVGAYSNAVSNTNTYTQSGSPFTGISTITNTLTITPAPLVLTVANVSKTYNANAVTVAQITAGSLTGGVADGVTYNAAQLMNGQTITGLGGLTFSGSAIGAVNASASTYPIDGSVGSGFSNYNVTITSGALTVNKAPLTITGASTINTYNGSAQTNAAATVTGLQGSDSVTVTGYATRTHAGVTTDSLVISGTLASNYTPTYVQGTLTIDPANLIVTGAVNSYSYTGAAQTNSGASVSGLKGSDTAIVTGYAQATHVAQGTVPDALVATLSNSADYSVTYNQGSLTITPIQLTAVVTSQTVQYNAAEQTTSYTVTGLKGSDTATAFSGTATGTNVGSYTSNLTLVASSDYYVGTITNGTLTITPAPLTIATGLTAQNKVYDTTTVASINATATQTLTGVLGSDLITVSSSGPYTGTFSQSNVGTNLNVAPVTTTTMINGVAYTTMAGVTLTGAAASNYYVTGLTTPIAANITPAPLTIAAGVTAQNKVYDGTTAATITASTQTLSGVLGGDAVSVSSTGPYTGTFSQSNVGSNLTVTPTTATSTIGGVDYTTMAGVTLTGAAAGNYYVTGISAPVTANITPYVIIPGSTTGPRIVATAIDKVYDTTTVANGSLAMAGLFGSDVVSVSYSAANFANPNVASGITVTFANPALSGADAANYTIGTGAVTAPAAITPAPLTITANTQSSFVTQALGALSYSSVGLLGGDTVTAATLATTATSSSAAGGYTTTVSAATISSGASNYAITYVPAVYTVIPAGQLRVNTTGAITPYGTAATYANPTASYLTTSGAVISNLSFVSATTVGGITTYTYADGANGTVSFNLSPTGTTTSTSGNIVIGTYPLAAANFASTTGNLTAGSAVVSGDLTVTPLAVNIAAAPVSYVYNGTTQSQAAAVATPSILAGDLVTVSGIATGRNVGVHNSNLSAAGTDAANYSFTYTNAALTITPYVIDPNATTGPRITATANNKVYDATTAATGALGMAGLFAGDVVAADYTSANFASKNVANTITVSFNGVTLSGPDAANYAVGSGAVTATANITPAPLTIATGLAAQNKVYDTTTAATISATGVQTLSGLLGTDTVTVASTGPYTGSFSQSNVGTGLAVTPTTISTTINGVAYTTMAGVTLSGADAGNYYVSGPSSTLMANITGKPITVAALDQASFYSKPLNALGYAPVVGLLAGASITGATVTTTATETGANSAAGPYPIAIGSAVGTGLSNYIITYVPATYTIVPAGQLLISTAGVTTPYGTGTSTAGPIINPAQPTATYIASNGAAISSLTYVSSSTSGTVVTYVFRDSANALVSFNLRPVTTSANISTSSNIEVGNYDYVASTLSAIPSGLTTTATATTGALTVTPLAITVTAPAVTRAYNGTIQQQGSPAVSVNTLANDLVTISGASSGKGVGVYRSSLNASGADIGNYQFTYINDNLTITPYIINFGASGPGISASANNKVYNTNNAATGSLNMVNLFAGDVVNANFGSASFGGSNVITNGIVTFNGVALSGPDALNYSIGATAVTARANITPAPVTISGLVASNKQYDGNTVAVVTGTPTITGLLGSDTSTLTGSVLSGVFASSNPGTGVGVTANLTNLILSNSNYYIADVTFPLTADIIAPPQTINNMAVVQQQVAQEFAQDRPTDRIKKGELIYVRDKDNLPEYLQAIEVPSTGAFKFPVPDSIIQDLINLSGENAALAKQAGSYKLLLLPKGSKLVVTLPDGAALPAGIKYDTGTNTFVVPKLGNITLPLSVKVTLMRGNQTLSQKIMVVTK